MMLSWQCVPGVLWLSMHMHDNTSSPEGKGGAQSDETPTLAPPWGCTGRRDSGRGYATKLCAAQRPDGGFRIVPTVDLVMPAQRYDAARVWGARVWGAGGGASGG